MSSMNTIVTRLYSVRSSSDRRVTPRTVAPNVRYGVWLAYRRVFPVMVLFAALLDRPTSAQCILADSKKLPASGAAQGDSIGHCVAISGDTAIVGARGDSTPAGSHAGSAYIYVRNGVTWSLQAQIFASDGAAGDNFGHSVALSGDIAIVGAIMESTSRLGAAYVFVRSGGVWTEQAKLTAPGTGEFGCSVAISGDTAVIGSRFEVTPAGSSAGSAYVFVQNAGIWTNEAHLFASDGDQGDWFGGWVGISGERVVVGAEKDEPFGNESGSAYVFERSGGVWTETAHLFASDGEPEDEFGNAVAIDGDTILIGAPDDTTPHGYRAGSAYVFDLIGGVWTETAHLAPVGDKFGIALDIEGDVAVFGTPVHDAPGGNASGSVLVCVRSGGAWIPNGRLIATNGGADDRLGSSVAISGDWVIGGAPLNDTPAGSNVGAAYAFDLADGGSPVVVTPPASQGVSIGWTAQMSAATCGAPALSFQWRRGGGDLSDGPTGSGSVISGANTNTLTVSQAQLSDSGVYDLVVTNVYGGVDSGDATLTVSCEACDVNCDGSVNPFDIQPFLDTLGGGTPCSACAGDADGNGTVNPFDINAFLACLGG